MISKRALVSKQPGKSVATSTSVAVGRGRLALLALAWAGLTTVGAPAASAQFPGGPLPSSGHPILASSASGLLTCRPERTVFKAGGPVKIHVEFVNRGKVALFMRILCYPVPASMIGVGMPPLKISVYNPVTHFFPYYTGPAVRPSPPPVTRLQPGASVGGSFDLSKFYRLPPGTYNVTVFYSDRMGPSRVGRQSVSTRNFISDIVNVKSTDFRVVP